MKSDFYGAVSALKNKERNPLSRKHGFFPVLHSKGREEQRERYSARFFLDVNIKGPTTNVVIK